jgi:hypothetical protein
MLGAIVVYYKIENASTDKISSHHLSFIRPPKQNAQQIIKRGQEHDLPLVWRGGGWLLTTMTFVICRQNCPIEYQRPGTITGK